MDKYKSDIDSFVCAVMPGSGSVQIRTTPGEDSTFDKLSNMFLFFIFMKSIFTVLLLLSFAGGLLYTRDSSNLQYATTITTVLFIYSKTLSSAGISGVQCRSAKFSPSQIRAFAKTQVLATFCPFFLEKSLVRLIRVENDFKSSNLLK